MSDEVIFDEAQKLPSLPEARAKPTTLSDVILHSGVVSSPGDAAILLAVCAMLLIAGSIYFLAASVPPPPTLGADDLRPGETVPNYVR